MLAGPALAFGKADEANDIAFIDVMAQRFSWLVPPLIGICHLTVEIYDVTEQLILAAL